MASGDRVIRRLIGVYDADGTVWGEVRYWLGARVGAAHCALCDITHGVVRERRDWRRCADGLPVPFDTFHRNDQPEAVRSGSGGQVPVVVAETVDLDVVVLVGPASLEDCGASPDRLVEAIEEAVARERLRWP